MTCRAEINRAFCSYHAAYDYLTSRGFLCLPRGWANGRWHASVASDGLRILVNVQLSPR